MLDIGKMPSERNHLVYSQLHKMTTLQFGTIEVYRNGVGAGYFDGIPVQIKNDYLGEWMVCGSCDDDRAQTYTRKNLKDPLEFDSLFRLYGPNKWLKTGKWLAIGDNFLLIWWGETKDGERLDITLGFLAKSSFTPLLYHPGGMVFKHCKMGF